MGAPTPKTPEDQLRAYGRRLMLEPAFAAVDARTREQLPAVIDAIAGGQPTDQFDPLLVSLLRAAFDAFHHKLTYVKRRRGA